MKEPKKIYNLQINEPQAKIIKTALEEYFRLRMNQWTDFVDEAALDGYVYNKEDPDNSQKFNAYIERRDKAKEMFEEAMKTAQPRRKTGEIIMQSEDVLVAQDIWQVIRHQLYLNSDSPKDKWCVDSREPLQGSNEPLPTMTLKK